MGDIAGSGRLWGAYANVDCSWASWLGWIE